jgi:hypothetical protein
MTQAWGGVPLTFVAANGNLTQLYPLWINDGKGNATGGDPATATPATLVRVPCEGELISVQVATDGSNAGTVEYWDIAGDDAGADVSQAAVITNAQLLTLKAAGKAQLLYSQDVVASGVTPPTTQYLGRFMRGLAARFIGAAGACSLNIVASGGFRFVHGKV